jgi:hypothetical protein
MARPRSPGTPEPLRLRTPLLRGRGRLLLFSTGAAAIVAAGAVLLHVAGARQTFSPGNVTSAHARIDLRCAQCHTLSTGVVDLRCERCHDPVGSERLQLSAHVLFGSGDAKAAESAGALNCAQCHVEHRGRDFNIRAVDDRECASCHTFRRLGAHPEFAALQATPGASLRFDHDRHVLEAEKAKGDTCQSCHLQSPDRRGFQPINFDRHCASCHLENGRLKGSTDPMELAWLAMPSGQPIAPRQVQTPVFTPANRGRETASGFVHRDPFVVFNAARLRRAVDRTGVETELSALHARIAYLEHLQTAPPPRLVPPGERAQAIDALRAEIAMFDGALSSSTASDDAALQELAGNAQAILTALGGDTAGIVADSAADFEARRRTLLRLVDAIEARIGANDRDRINRLRRQILALTPGGQGVEDMTRARRQRQRQLDRLLIEADIESSPVDRVDQPSQDVAMDRGELERSLTQLRAQRDELERSPRTTAPADDTERAAQARTLVSLLTPCRKCHEMDAAATRLQPVRVAQPVLRRSVFNHAPHTIQAKCESCHAGVRTSKAAADVNVPPIDSCRTCHNRSQVRDDCATCHRFHPSSVVHMMAALP